MRLIPETSLQSFQSWLRLPHSHLARHAKLVRVKQESRVHFRVIWIALLKESFGRTFQILWVLVWRLPWRTRLPDLLCKSVALADSTLQNLCHPSLLNRVNSDGMILKDSIEYIRAISGGNLMLFRPFLYLRVPSEMVPYKPD